MAIRLRDRHTRFAGPLSSLLTSAHRREPMAGLQLALVFHPLSVIRSI